MGKSQVFKNNELGELNVMFENGKVYVDGIQACTMLYRLILKSKLPSAKNFERWICDEVLPSIRKDGMYMTDNAIEETLNNPDFIIQMATKLKEERAEKFAQMERANNLESIITLDKPYTNFAKHIEASDGSFKASLYRTRII